MISGCLRVRRSKTTRRCRLIPVRRGGGRGSEHGAEGSGVAWLSFCPDGACVSAVLSNQGWSPTECCEDCADELGLQRASLAADHWWVHWEECFGGPGIFQRKAFQCPDGSSWGGRIDRGKNLKSWEEKFSFTSGTLSGRFFWVTSEY